MNYRTLKDAFDGKKHADVCNGRKTEDECITDFLEIIETHHNTYNNFAKSDKVSKDEFLEFYRTLSPNYEDEATFISMVRGVWGVKNEKQDSASMGFAGGKDAAINSRDRYQKANSNKPAPFGTFNQDQ